MDSISTKLTRPVTGFAVLGGVALILVLIVIAAYHGSSTTTASECGPARGVLSRTSADATTLQKDGETPQLLASLQRDDNDVNNFINGEQHPDAGFDGRMLAVPDALGRVISDLQGVSLHTAADEASLRDAVTTLTQYCGT